MIVAVMQPYLFPYLGYFQLCSAADVFVLYDDAHYIKGGYINRNSILVDGVAHRFTVPVQGGSSNKRIKDVYFSLGGLKLLRTIEQSYRRAPFYDAVHPILQRLLGGLERVPVTDLCEASLQAIADYIGLPTRILRSSSLSYDQTQSASGKLVEICRSLGADTYVNSIGGKDLYDPAFFKYHELNLKFLKPAAFVYPQLGGQFHPNLSIIDVLMNCAPSAVAEALKRYELL